jgi:glycopeptide antibiotics resistance protein
VVLASVAAGGTALIAWRLSCGSRLTWLRALTGVAAVLYMMAVVYFTFLPLHLGPDQYEREWWVWVQIVPFQDLLADPIGLILNVLLFVPLGLLAPLLVRVRRWGEAALAGLLVSAAVEALQFIADLTISPGRVADIDDLIANVVGAVLGFLLLQLLLLVPVFRRIAAEASWPAPAAPRRSYRESGTLDDGSGEARTRRLHQPR